MEGINLQPQAATFCGGWPGFYILSIDLCCLLMVVVLTGNN